MKLGFKENNIKHDKFDESSFSKIHDNSNELQNVVNQGLDKVNTFKKMMQDIYYSFFKYLPSMHDEADIDERFLMNRNFVENIMNSPDFENFRVYTKLNDLQSAFASIAMGSKVLEKCSKEIEEQNKQNQSINKLKKSLKSLNNKVKGLSHAMKNTKNKTKKAELKNLKTKLNQQKKKVTRNLKVAVKTLKNTQKHQSQRVTQKMTQALQEIMDESQRLESMMTWGHTPGNVQQLSYREKIKIAEDFMKNRHLKRLAQIIGKLKKLALSKMREKISKSSTEIHSVQRGNRLQFLIPSELMKLNEKLRLIFYKDYIEKNLLQYDIKSKKDEGRGDIIMAIDVSGSMSGEPEIWCKAIALAITEIAFKQKRNVIVLFFDIEVQKIIEFNRNDKNFYQKMIQLAGTFTGGGTKFKPPLKEAMRLIMEKKFKNADILFLTDGWASLPRDFMKSFTHFKNEYKVKVFSVCISASNKATEVLEEFSDHIKRITEFSEDIAGDLFNNVA